MWQYNKDDECYCSETRNTTSFVSVLQQSSCLNDNSPSISREALDALNDFSFDNFNNPDFTHLYLIFRQSQQTTHN